MIEERAPFYTIDPHDVVARFEPRRQTFMFSQYGEPREVVGYIVCNIDDVDSVETETFLLDHKGFLNDKDLTFVFYDKCERCDFELAYERFSQLDKISKEKFEKMCNDLGFEIIDDYIED